MKEINIFCFGFGQVAKNFIKKINNEGASFKLTTTSRENSQKKTFENIHYESFQFSEKSFDKNLISRLKEADHILFSIAPVKGEDIVIKNFQNYFKPNKLHAAAGNLIEPPPSLACVAATIREATAAAAPPDDPPHE